MRQRKMERHEINGNESYTVYERIVGAIHNAHEWVVIAGGLARNEAISMLSRG